MPTRCWALRKTVGNHGIETATRRISTLRIVTPGADHIEGGFFQAPSLLFCFKNDQAQSFAVGGIYPVPRAETFRRSHLREDLGREGCCCCRSLRWVNR